MARGSQAQTAPVARIVTETPRLQYSVTEFMRLNSISRSQVYAEMSEGRLVGRKMGGKTVIWHDDMEIWRRRMPVVVSYRGRPREAAGAAA